MELVAGSQYGVDWAMHGKAAPLVYGLLGEKKLKFARKSAQDEANRRFPTHPRYRAPVTNDDVIAQLMFGSWVRLIYAVSGPQSQQEALWKECLHMGFPGVDSSDVGRVRLGKQLERIRKLRNRVAHHDNLLDVEVPHRLNDMLAVLRGIDSRFPAVAMSRSQVRRVLGTDPRRLW